MAQVDVVKGSFLSSFLQNTLKSNQVEINTDSRTLRPIAKLKEPRDLFALPKELDCPQQAARWPTECQVLEERVCHIDYTPATPESYYQPTGKEIQPKPVGDEVGTVVFQYYPTSAVNYFSRSSVGGSRYFLPSCSRENEDDLRFESRFESGNLAKAVKVTDAYYELSLRTDLYTNRHMQWFYFRIDNTKANVMYRFSIVNLSKAESLYTCGMRPLLYSTKDAVLNQIGWRRCADNITYFRNDSQNGDEEQTSSYTLSFNLDFPYDNDTVYLAHCYPYTYSDLQDYLIKLQNHPVKSTYSKLRLLCRSLAGNNVYYLTITSPCLPDEPKKKKAVVITGRVHPGETPSSWMMKGFMDFLTGDSEQAKELREKFIFKLVPMLNPDGVIVGNNRCSLTGRDLNRQYRTVIRETYPSIWHTKLMIRRLMEECGIVMYCDLHAHSRKHNVFIYGCENKRYPDKRLYEQVFPLMLHKNAADKFSFENCKFRIQRSKEGTGRVVIWMMGVCNSYTMEASFGGSTLGSRVDTHFSVQDYENIGRAFCETLLDFCDEDPTKERLRSKIVNRLVQEGSSADEPTNIDLSDYSSDEGDTSSCSDDETFGNAVSLSAPPSSPSCSRRKTLRKERDATNSPKTNRQNQQHAYTSPLPRKILQIHCANLDLLNRDSNLLSVGLDYESGDESLSGQNPLKKNDKNLDSKENSKLLNRGDMPPELIVTPAQVYEFQMSVEGNEAASKDPKETKDAEPFQPYSNYSWSPKRVKSQILSKLSSSRTDFGSEIRMGFHRSISLRQKLWTGIEYLDSGPLTWSAPPLSANEAVLRSCSQKLSSLKEQRSKGRTKTPNREKKQEKTSAARKKYKQALVKMNELVANSETLDQGEQNDYKKQKLKKKNIRNKKCAHNENNSFEDRKPEKQKSDSSKLYEKELKEGTTKQPLKVTQKTQRRGSVSNSPLINSVPNKPEDLKIRNEPPGNDIAFSKKKKKRKFLNIHRKIRKVINTVTATGGNKTS